MHTCKHCHAEVVPGGFFLREPGKELPGAALSCAARPTIRRGHTQPHEVTK